MHQPIKHQMWTAPGTHLLWRDANRLCHGVCSGRLVARQHHRLDAHALRGGGQLGVGGMGCTGRVDGTPFYLKGEGKLLVPRLTNGGQRTVHAPQCNGGHQARWHHTR